MSATDTDDQPDLELERPADPRRNGGYMIRGTFFTFPVRYRLGDPVLVQEITGLDFADYLERLEAAADEGIDDQRVMLGMMSVGVWQARPGWKRERVVRFINNVWQGEVEIIDSEPEVEAGLETDETGAIIPPEVPATTPATPAPASSDDGATASTEPPASPSAPPSPSSTGAPTSATSSPEQHPA